MIPGEGVAREEENKKSAATVEERVNCMRREEAVSLVDMISVIFL